ncbi:MAG: hypothetical protein ACYTAF_02930 [Planctomycetota bacterium]
MRILPLLAIAVLLASCAASDPRSEIETLRADVAKTRALIEAQNGRIAAARETRELRPAQRKRVQDFLARGRAVITNLEKSLKELEAIGVEDEQTRQSAGAANRARVDARFDRWKANSEALNAEITGHTAEGRRIVEMLMAAPKKQ